MIERISRAKTVLADLGLFYAAAIWGSTFFIVKDALDDIDPVTMVGYRFTLAGLILLVYLFLSKRPVFKDIGKAAFLAIILWLLYVPQTIGLKYTSASNSGFITGLFVLFVPLFLKLVLHKNPTRLDIIASVVSLSGLWVLTGGLHDINPGDLLTLIAALTYALHVIFSDKYMKSGIDPYSFSCQQFLIVGILSLITSAILGLSFKIGSRMTFGVVVFLAVFPSLSAFVIQMLAQKITAPVKVSLIFALEPVFAAIFAWWLGGEQFVLRRAMGGLLIVAALVISSFSARTPYKKAVEP